MEQSHGRPATQIEVEAFQAIANLQDENRELRIKVRIAYEIAENLHKRMKELISACDTVAIFIDTNCSHRIDEEYRLLVIEPFNKALARAKGED